MGKLNRSYFEKNLLTTQEALELLGISRVRLSQLVKARKLTPVKRSIFLKEDVLKRKLDQEKLRQKYYRPKV